MTRAPQQPAPQPVQSVAQLKYFSGMQPNSDPNDTRPGVSLHQVNVMVGPPNELRVRLGCKQITFDSI